MSTYRSINDRLTAAQVALDNAQVDPVLQEALGAFGYSTERLQEGEDLLARARDAHETMAVEYGDQYDATDAMKRAYETANTTYMRHLKVARVALQDRRGIAQKLGLNGRRKSTLADWVEQARPFYDNALSSTEVQTALGRFGITAEQLEGGRAQIEAVAAANAVQEREKGEAQDATKRRDASIDDLDAWMSDFRAIARIALEDQPQQLEKLGINAPS
jgi:predicted RecB family endonuclease